jgi:hypothetical protein
MGYLQAALASSTNERVRAWAAGWRISSASEPAPNNGVLYVFVLDQTVTGADYSLGRILADAPIRRSCRRSGSVLLGDWRKPDQPHAAENSATGRDAGQENSATGRDAGQDAATVAGLALETGLELDVQSRA